MQYLPGCENEIALGNLFPFKLFKLLQCLNETLLQVIRNAQPTKEKKTYKV